MADNNSEMQRGRPGICAWKTVCARAAIFLAFPTTARSQTPQPQNERQSFHLAALKFAGLSVYTEAQVTAEIGLRAGDGVSLERLAPAQDRLAKPGAFDRISYHYVTHGNELTAEYELVETRNTLPCLFDNFVWFSQEQIDQTLRHRIPFYTGNAPERGTTADEISDALRALLQSNRINATVEKVLFSERIRGGFAGFLFQVKGIAPPTRRGIRGKASRCIDSANEPRFFRQFPERVCKRRSNAALPAD